MFNLSVNGTDILFGEFSMEQSSNNPLNNYVLYTGGAYGADTLFGVLADQYGVGKQFHIRPIGNTKIHKTLVKLGYGPLVAPEDKLAFARDKIQELIGLKLTSNLGNNLKARNYFQVSNSESVLAVAKLKPDMKSVYGGTDVAVGLSIALNLPTYVLDVTTESWYMYDSIAKKFTPFSGVPPLTRKFTGVGTRDIENYNIKDKVSGNWVPRKEFVGEAKAETLSSILRQVFL